MADPSAIPAGIRPLIQYVVNELGYAVVAPNIRGSAGYGKSYTALDDGLLRDDAVKDLGRSSSGWIRRLRWTRSTWWSPGLPTAVTSRWPR